VEGCFQAALGGDDGFSGLITKNPQHPHWWTLKGPQSSYDLVELAEYVDLAKFKPRQGVKVAEIGLGRNVTAFDFLRLWAYREVRKYKGQPQGFVTWQNAVYQRCLSRNGDFATPMMSRECWHIAKSVAQWVWKRFDIEASDARFSKLQSWRILKRWEELKALQKDRIEEADNDKANGLLNERRQTNKA
jgi:hypothetical protein